MCLEWRSIKTMEVSLSLCLSSTGLRNRPWVWVYMEFFSISFPIPTSVLP